MRRTLALLVLATYAVACGGADPTTPPTTVLRGADSATTTTDVSTSDASASNETATSVELSEGLSSLTIAKISPWTLWREEDGYTTFLVSAWIHEPRSESGVTDPPPWAVTYVDPVGRRYGAGFDGGVIPPIDRHTLVHMTIHPFQENISSGALGQLEVNLGDRTLWVDLEEQPKPERTPFPEPIRLGDTFMWDRETRLLATVSEARGTEDGGRFYLEIDFIWKNDSLGPGAGCPLAFDEVFIETESFHNIAFDLVWEDGAPHLCSLDQGEETPPITYRAAIDTEDWEHSSEYFVDGYPVTFGETLVLIRNEASCPTLPVDCVSIRGYTQWIPLVLTVSEP